MGRARNARARSRKPMPLLLHLLDVFAFALGSRDHRDKQNILTTESALRPALTTSPPATRPRVTWPDRGAGHIDANTPGQMAAKWRRWPSGSSICRAWSSREARRSDGRWHNPIAGEQAEHDQPT